MHFVKLAEDGAAESRGGVIAPARKRRLAPEVVPINVAVSEVHGALVGLIVVFARNVRYHWEAARDDSP